MFSIAITERGGHQRQLDVDGSEIRIGRLEENEIVLPRGNVSKRHARVSLEDDRYVVRDLGSTNGTYVNGRRITGPTVIVTGDKLYIGDFILALRGVRDSEADDFDLGSAELLDEDAAFEIAGPAEREPSPSSSAAAVSARPGGAAHPDAVSLPGSASARRGPPLLTSPSRYKRGRTLAPPAAPSGANPPAQVPATHAPVARSFTNTVEMAPAAAAAPAASVDPDPQRSTRRDAPVSGEWPASNRPSSATPPQPDSDEPGSATTPAVLPPSLRLQGALQTLMERLGAQMDLTEPTERALSGDHQLTLERLLDELAREGTIAPDVDRRFLVQAAISEAVGLGPLDRLLNNRAVRQVVVDGPVHILADLGGGLAPVSSFFSSSEALQTALHRLLRRAGRELGDDPVVEQWLPDGSLVQVVQAPLSACGPLLSIRRAPKPAVTLDQLVTEGMLSIEMLELLKRAIALRLNVLVVGAPGSGVSTLLGVLASMADEDERIVTWEEVPSLAIRHSHVLPLRAGAVGAAGLADLLRCIARMQADRLVIDDLAARDVPLLLPALASQRGIFAGMHLQASSAGEAARQLERFAFGHACPVDSPVVGAAFRLRLHIDGQGSGVRRVLGLTELRIADTGELDLARLYRYEGGFLHTGRRASFVADGNQESEAKRPPAPKGFLSG